MCLRCFDRAPRRYFHSPRNFLGSLAGERRSLTQRPISRNERLSNDTETFNRRAIKTRAGHERDSPRVRFPERFLGETEFLSVSNCYSAAFKKILFSNPLSKKAPFSLFHSSLHSISMLCSIPLENEILERVME